MSTLERARFRALATKVETTAGTDVIAGTPATADWTDAAFEFSPDYVLTPNPSWAGSLDQRPGIVGGGRFMLQGVRVPIRGSGTAGTEPEWFRLLKAAGMVQTDTAAAVGAPTAATAGTAVTATLQSPFDATTDLYLGMPIILAGNPSTAKTTLVTQYTSGRVARLSRSFSPVLDTNTTAQIPINNMLKLSDTVSDWPRLTVYAYEVGQLAIGVGCIVLNPRIVLVNGDMAFLECDIMGSLSQALTETSLPSGAAAVSRATPPQWRNGECQLGLSITDRNTVRAYGATLGLGSTGIYTPDPENANGFGLAELMARRVAAEVAIMANSTNGPTRRAAMTAGDSALMFSAILGTTAGNRIGILLSPAVLQQIRQGQRDGADTETLSLVPTTPGIGVYISAF